MEDDYHPYYLRVEDSWNKIDYSGSAKDWMKPWKAGRTVDLVEIPSSWYLDDAPPTMFVKAMTNSHGWITGRQLGEIWQDQFDWVTAISTTLSFQCAFIQMPPASRTSDDARAVDRPYVEAFRCSNHHLRRNGRRFPASRTLRQ